MCLQQLVDTVLAHRSWMARSLTLKRVKDSSQRLVEMEFLTAD